MLQTPPFLYKYLPPERVSVVVDCRIRFTQRNKFEDDHELKPDYLSFGTLDEIKRHIVRTTGGAFKSGETLDGLATLIHTDKEQQKLALQVAVSSIKSLDQLGVLSLTVDPHSERMWREYAAQGGGIVVGFDTEHEGFRKLTHPMGVRPVMYSDGALPTFLSMMEQYPFLPLYLKRGDYSFEKEWRSLRLFKDLESHPNEVYLSPFDPACVSNVILGPACRVEREMRDILSGHSRYQHIKISNM
jgi:hypothetical protein